MKFTAALLCLVGSANAFAPMGSNKATSNVVLQESVEVPMEAVAEPEPEPVAPFRAADLPGVVAPLGFFDPLDFADKADKATMMRYREAEVTHGRVAMLATVGFLVGEKVEGSSFLFDSQISGPGITHLAQVPVGFWVALTIAIGASEQYRATTGWVEPENVPFDKPGLLREGYVPGDLGFDPLGLKPKSEDGLKTRQTKELQNGRLAMIGVVGIVIQELIDGKGIVEHFSG